VLGIETERGREKERLKCYVQTSKGIGHAYPGKGKADYVLEGNVHIERKWVFV
jgi:hypothetical protein